MTRPLVALALLAGCTASDPYDIVDPQTDDITEEKPDETAPSITHDPIDGSQPIGQDVTIVAEVADDEGSVLAVEVFFKSETTERWPASKSMVHDGESWVWAGAIPGDAVKGGGVDYYLLAVDDVGNQATYPTDGPNHPLHFRVDGG